MKKNTLLLLAALMGAQHTMAQFEDAKWIGTTQPVLYSDYLPIFRYYSTLQLDEKSRSTTASVLLGGNDPRLMNRNLNLEGMEMERDSSYIRIEFDASQTPARLNVFRAGYAKGDASDKVFAAFDIPEDVVSASDIYKPVNLQIEGTASKLHLHSNRESLRKQPRLHRVSATGRDWLCHASGTKGGHIQREGNASPLAPRNALCRRETPDNRREGATAGIARPQQRWTAPSEKFIQDNEQKD